MPIPTPSQTIGPYLHIAFGYGTEADMAGAAAKGERIALSVRVLDADGAPVNDAMIELWQANAAGRYDHPEDKQDKPLDPAFSGFGRAATGEDGRATFRTVKPGPVPGLGNALQAPHISLSVFARGVNKRLATRLYFPDEKLNADDPVLALVSAPRRKSLVARRSANGFEFDVVLGGRDETVFFIV